MAMAASTLALPSIQVPILPKSSFWSGTPQTHLLNLPFPPSKPNPMKVYAKFQLSELLGGRGLCNGEEGLQKLLENPPAETPQSQPPPPQTTTTTTTTPTTVSTFGIGEEEAFEKELMGLTGGFPGGEKGLKKFVEENPPPPPKKKTGGVGGSRTVGFPGSKPSPPELPLLMPGMIVIVKNPSNPFHMYCGVVQRVTDGKAGVLFEGGNWDKLITFQLDELERREKGPPMVNPKSAIIESTAER